MDKLTLMLVAGVPEDEARAAAAEHLGLDEATAAAAVAQAQRAIVLAAAVDRKRELGIAITRLRGLYHQAVEMAEPKVALAAQKELNRLMGLYDVDRIAQEAAAAATGASKEAGELAEIAAHVLPLQLAPPSHPLAEHVRIAADLARRAHAHPTPRIQT